MIPDAKRSGVLPVSEANTFCTVNTSEIVNETKQDETDNQGDLQERRDQLDFSVDPDEEQIGGKGDD